MSKPSKRPGRAARDVHATIRAQAEELRRAPRTGIRNAEEMPEIAALMLAYRRAVERAVPPSLVFEGRTYYVRAAVAVKMEIFDSPGAAVPLVSGATCSPEGFGHAPGH